MKNIVRSELKRAVKNPLTWIGLFVGLYICFLPMMEQFQAIFQLGLDVVKDGENLANTLNGWKGMRLLNGMGLILPVLSMLPLGLSYCDDWVTGYSRFYVLRSQRKAYLLGKLTAALIASFSLVFLLSLFSAVVLSFIYTPFDSRYDKQIISQVYVIYVAPDGSRWVPALLYNWIYFGKWSGPIIFVLDSFLSGLFAAMCCAFGLAVSALFPNRYVAFSAPFVFSYLAGLGAALLSRLAHWVKIFKPDEWYQPYELSKLPLTAVLCIGMTILAVWCIAFWKLANRRMEHAL